MNDLSEHFLKVADKLYYATEESTAEAIRDNIREHGVQRILDYIDETKREHGDNVDHPGVPMVVVYAAHEYTPFQFEYYKNPAVVTEASDDFYYPDVITKAIGDSTVLASSAMAPGIKWIYEH
jgi:lecithin-cholesterol acyltransferase